MANDESNESKLDFMGRDLAQIPCFRSSLLNGIGGGVAGGLAYFMFTSKVRKACNVAVFSFTGITLSYWFYCRYQWSTRKFNMTIIQAAMKEQIAAQGTEKAVKAFNPDMDPR